jgi:hypothetical protein
MHLQGQTPVRVADDTDLQAGFSCLHV